ncbi:hypothetical protein KIL84_021623 [Mauremys mutica]|uniref:Uncharacterized protein n=1 Tax=Mauremys mutica TaxID=74926 RepID=A0A9D3X4D4_9SAUR|nr:hypothetical protein KIL84_021623 [Mauremys mutica]
MGSSEALRVHPPHSVLTGDVPIDFKGNRVSALFENPTPVQGCTIKAGQQSTALASWLLVKGTLPSNSVTYCIHTESTKSLDFCSARPWEGDTWPASITS